MADTDFLPSREADLLAWSVNFNARLQAGGPGGAYGLSGVQTAAYLALHNSWSSAFTAANSDITRTPVSIIAKNDAKNNLINGVNGIRELVAIVQANPATTNEDRGELQITVPDVEPTPVPVPAFAPGIEIVSSVGRVVKFKLKDVENPESRGKPAGVDGAAILSFVGTLPPAPEDIGAWKFEGVTGRVAGSVEFPVSVASGSTAWITAYWFNTRKEAGPPAQPVSAQIPGTLSQVA